ncbi:MAG: HAD-IIB family hydrolase [Planctomycetaceae bacterium]
MSSKNRLLATDLDGTLIPPETATDHSPELRALQRLKQSALEGELAIVYVTGRHIESVLQVMETVSLPRPTWIICDVGSSLYVSQQESYQIVDDYVTHLDQVTGGCDAQSLRSILFSVDGLTLQEAEKQRRYKLSYYCDSMRIQTCVAHIETILQAQDLPYGVISSIDPFDGRGLIDVLPANIDKAYALNWWAAWQGLDPKQIVFAGDSGNDYAAFISGFRGILVGNADIALADRLRMHHLHAGTSDRIYFAKSIHTAGVLEGCRHYRLIGHEDG